MRILFKDQSLAYMIETKEFGNRCSLERTTLNASSALAAALFIKRQMPSYQWGSKESNGLGNAI